MNLYQQRYRAAMILIYQRLWRNWAWKFDFTCCPPLSTYNNVLNYPACILYPLSNTEGRADLLNYPACILYPLSNTEGRADLLNYPACILYPLSNTEGRADLLNYPACILYLLSNTEGTADFRIFSFCRLTWWNTSKGAQHVTFVLTAPRWKQLWERNRVRRRTTTRFVRTWKSCLFTPGFLQILTFDFAFLKPFFFGFHTLVSEVRIVSVAECFVERSGPLYGNTLAIVSNDPYIRSESIVPIQPCSILASRLCDLTIPWQRRSLR